MATLSHWAQQADRSPKDMEAWIEDCRPPKAAHKSAEEITFLLNALIKRRLETKPGETEEVSVTAAVKELVSITGKTESACYYYRAYRNLLPELLTRVGSPSPTGLDSTTARILSKFPKDRQMAIYNEAQGRYIQGKGVARKIYLDAIQKHLEGEETPLPPRPVKKEKPVFDGDAFPPPKKKPEVKKEEPKIWGTYVRPQEDGKAEREEKGYTSRVHKSRWNRGNY